MFYCKMHCILWLSICHISYSAESLCERKLLGRVNISTELQSDVLLPCNFNPTLLGSDKTADIAVIWYQRNTTVHSLVEISLKGEVSSWDHKHGRIKVFPEFSESGNFSILIQKVQKFDLSLYYCELFNGSSCSIAYQDVQLVSYIELAAVSISWPLIAGGGGGGAVALILLVVLTCYIKRACRKSSNEHIYANTRFKKTAERNKKLPDNKPENHTRVYAKKQVEAGEIYVNRLQ